VDELGYGVTKLLSAKIHIYVSLVVLPPFRFCKFHVCPGEDPRVISPDAEHTPSAVIRSSTTLTVCLD